MLTFPQDFASTLKDHLLARVLGRQYDAQLPTFTEEDRNQLYISEDCLEQWYGMNVFYTTYDLRCGKDQVKMKNRSYIMMLSQDEHHPYAYAQVLRIFKVDVLHGPTMLEEARMDIIWVCWFKIDKTYRAGWKAKRLYRLKFVPPPSRMAHLAFSIQTMPFTGHTSSLVLSLAFDPTPPAIPASVWDPKEESNWDTYYVNQ